MVTKIYGIDEYGRYVENEYGERFSIEFYPYWKREPWRVRAIVTQALDVFDWKWNTRNGLDCDKNDEEIASLKEIETFLLGYSTPDGQISTTRDSLARGIWEWIESGLDSEYLR